MLKKRMPYAVITIVLLVFLILGWQLLQYPNASPTFAQLRSMPAVPSLKDVPPGKEGELILKGHREFMDTAHVLPQYVKNDLSCSSCHADGGTGPAINLVGINRVFPQYNSRSGTEIDLVDRVQQCFERSMNGIAPDRNSEAMQAMVAYLNYISQNVPADIQKRAWVPKLSIGGTLPTPNLQHGADLYAQACAVCHGQNGEGGGYGPNNGPALWGDGSFNIGAGMGRIRTIAGYIQRYMPKFQMGQYGPGTLSTQDAVDLAAYILAHPRPDRPQPGAYTVNGSPSWDVDWPKGEQPDDIAYFNKAMKQQGLDKDLTKLPWFTAYAERAVGQNVLKNIQEAHQKAAEEIKKEAEQKVEQQK